MVAPTLVVPVSMVVPTLTTGEREMKSLLPGDVTTNCSSRRILVTGSCKGTITSL